MGAPLDLVVGLGNPGRDYALTRHNAGVWFVERLALRHGASFKGERKFHGKVARVNLEGRDLKLLIPDTYMNESGKSVAAFVNFHKIDVRHCLVAHDELDFPIGTIRFKQGGGLAGHNGLRSVSDSLGGNRDFSRLRIGVGHPGDRQRVTAHVLGGMSAGEKAAVDQCIDAALDVLPLAARGDWEAAKLRLHGAAAGTDGEGGTDGI